MNINKNSLNRNTPILAAAVVAIVAMLLSTFLVSHTEAAAALWSIARTGSAISIADTGAISIAPKSGKRTTVTRGFVPYSTKTVLTPGANVTVDSTLGNYFTLTPAEAENINATTVGAQGQPLIIEVVTSGTNSYVLTFNTNFKSTGTLTTGTVSAKTFVISFLSNGTNYVETGRTAAQ